MCAAALQQARLGDQVRREGRSPLLASPLITADASRKLLLGVAFGLLLLSLASRISYIRRQQALTRRAGGCGGSAWLVFAAGITRYECPNPSLSARYPRKRGLGASR